MSRFSASLSFLAILLAACGVDLSPDDGGGGPGPGVEKISHVENDDGSLTTTVDATHMEDWVYLDLDSARQVEEGDPRWDLGFQRMNIVGNGASGVLVAWVEGQDMGAVPDESEFRADPEDRELALIEGIFQTTDPNDPTGPGAWYAYQLSDHTLVPRERVYFVKSDEGALFALIFLDYYDDAGTSGYIQFRWIEVSQ